MKLRREFFIFGIVCSLSFFFYYRITIVVSRMLEYCAVIIYDEEPKYDRWWYEKVGMAEIRIRWGPPELREFI